MGYNDSSERYGKVSRVLHWGMALLFFWIFLSAGAHYALEDTAIEQWLWPTHKPVGFLLFVLVWLRLVWALTQRSKRPASLSEAAGFGHGVIYLFMLAIPGVALLRQYGSGRAFEPFGLPVMPGFDGDKISWMTDLGSLLHSNLGWLFLLVIIGHILMVFWHRRSADTDVLPRMWR